MTQKPNARLEFVESLSGVLQISGVLILSPLLRGWYNRWGASEAELHSSLPGDDLVPDPLLGYTHAITIDTPAERVWPWLVQLGQGRGGLYSFEKLENLAGCNIHNTDRILPEFQNLQVGDMIRLGPKGYPCFSVSAIEPRRSLVLISLNPQTEQRVPYLALPGKGYSIATWQFILEPLGEQATRLLVRQRLAYSPDMAWVWRLTEPVAFVMERKMLRNIRRLAEQEFLARSVA
jgi:hypothetical protein